MDKIEQLIADSGMVAPPEVLYKCTDCGVEKPASEFYADKYSKTGLRHECKECRKAENSAPEALALKRARRKVVRQRDPRKFMYNAAKNRAQQLEVPFTITLENIYLPKYCPIFGILLKVGVGHQDNDSPTLDRINPSLGYVPGNVAVICKRANTIKNDATLEELESLYRYLKSFERVGL